jgi:hypothetical protein
MLLKRKPQIGKETGRIHEFLQSARKQKRHPKKSGALCIYCDLQMARVTRLELAASAVTGRRSNQLSYTRASEVGLLYRYSSPCVNAIY